MKKVLLDVTVEAEKLWEFLSEPTEELQAAFEKAAKIVPVDENGEPCSGTFNIQIKWSE